MLQDLEDSDALMDRFCNAELLESLDQALVRTGTHDEVDLSINVQ